MKRTTPRTSLVCTTAFSALLCAAASAHAAEPPPAVGVLNTCESAIGNQPRTAMQGCLKTSLKKAQDTMRAAYAQLESELKKIDSAATPEALHTLKHSQDSFNSFLHKECKRQGAAMLGGSGAGDMELACQVALTQWRAAQLRQH